MPVGRVSKGGARRPDRRLVAGWFSSFSAAGGLPEGVTLVVAGEAPTRKGGSTNNPFAVKMFSGKKP